MKGEIANKNSTKLIETLEILQEQYMLIETYNDNERAADDGRQKLLYSCVESNATRDEQSETRSSPTRQELFSFELMMPLFLCEFETHSTSTLFMH